MQSVAKKSGFKCPTFSVPSGKPKSENNEKHKDAVEKPEVPKSKLKLQKQPGSSISTPATNSGDNNVDENLECSHKASEEACLPPEGVHGQDTPAVEDETVTDDSTTIPTPEDNNKQQEEKAEEKTSECDIIKKKEKPKFGVMTATKTGTKDTSIGKTANAENKVKDMKKQKKYQHNKAPKDKIQKEPKVPKPKKEKKEPKDPKELMPVRSLTDEEYEALFTGALETAMALDMDVWEPKCSEPKPVKVPVVKKYSITVGKKKTAAPPKSPSVKSTQDNTQESSQPDNDHTEIATGLDSEDEHEGDGEDTEMLGQDKHAAATSAQSDDGDVEDAVKEDNTEEVDDAENKEHNDDTDGDDDVEQNEEEVVEEVQDHPVVERASTLEQAENETTPAVSEAGDDSVVKVCDKLPIKKKKHVVKKSKLEPKQLPFQQKKSTDENTEAAADEHKKPVTTVKEKIKKLKQMHKEHSVPKKRKLDNPETKTKTETGVKNKKSVEASHGDKPKTKPKISRKKLKKMMMERDLDNNGTWVQCCNTTCLKWRHLPDMLDPSQIPDRWTCKMNTRDEYNSCEKPEEKYDETEHIYTKYTEGSVVWAKMTGFPWWPAMVECDPDTHSYFSIDSEDSMVPTRYHVVFFDEKVSRVWVKTDNIRIFSGKEEADGVPSNKLIKGKPGYRKEINIANRNASRALKCNLQERIELFGFAAKFKGQWGCVGESSQEKENTKLTTKPKKPQKVTATVDDGDYLDDSTMDDVLGNTEAILDNVEEMLDSINSQLDDSDEDSDFDPVELVVVEKKAPRKPRVAENTPTTKARKLPMLSPDMETKEVKGTKENRKSNKEVYEFEDDVMDSEIVESKPESDALNEENTESKKNDSKVCSKETESDAVKNISPNKVNDEQSKTTDKSDTDIYTMETDKSQSSHVEEEVKANDKKINKKSEKKVSIKSEKGKKETGEKTKGQKRSFTAPEENDKKEVTKSESNEVTKPKKVKVSKKAKEVETNKKDITKDHKVTTREHKEEKKETTEVLELDNYTDKDDSTKLVNKELPDEKKPTNIKTEELDLLEKDLNNNVPETEKDKKQDSDDDFDLCEDVHNTNDKQEDANNKNDQEMKANESDEEFDICVDDVDDNKNTSSNTNNDGKVLNDASGNDSDNEFDLCDDVDYKSAVDNGEDGNVPDINDDNGEPKVENTNTSIDSESDDDFDLVERSMYDGVEEGAEKIREREVLPVSMTNYSEEDSDPFDLMEE